MSIWCVVLLSAVRLSAQCPDDNFYIGDFTPPCPGSISSSCVFGGEYVSVFVVEGQQYTFSTCGLDEFDTELTVLDDLGTTVIGYNDDFCGDQSTVTWVATYTGNVLVLVDEHGCDDRDECANLSVTCGDDGGGGPSEDGCNTDVILCQNSAGPFNFGLGGPPVGSCQDFLSNSQFTYILVNITTDGPLNLLIEGDATSGFLDVSVWNIPDGVPPCEAIQDIGNEIGCNYASAFSGCNQFGNFFPCASSVPSPNVYSGQTILIVVEDWQNGPSDSFNLFLGPPPNAQSGPPDPTILTVGPYCISSNAVQLTATDAGGTWSGVATTANGLFDPSQAGLGTHTVNYTIGQAPCTASSVGEVTVIESPIAAFFITDNTICYGEPVIIEFFGTPNSTVVFEVNNAQSYSVSLNGLGVATFSLADLSADALIDLTEVSVPGTPPCITLLPDPSLSISVSPPIVTSPIGHQ